MNEERVVAIAERVILWLLWCIFVAALVYYRMVLVGPEHNTVSLAFPEATFGRLQYFVPLLGSLGTRWLIIPRVRLPFVSLVPFLIIGMPATMLLVFFGIFLSPASFSAFFYTTIILMLMWMPIWRFNVEPQRRANPPRLALRRVADAER